MCMVAQESDDETVSFERFFVEEYPRVVRLAWFLTRSDSAAEDIAQEALLATHSRFDELEEPTAFLTRVVVNQCRSWQRKTISTRRMLRSIPVVDVVSDSSIDVEVLDAIARLPYRQQVVVVTRYWGGVKKK